MHDSLGVGSGGAGEVAVPVDWGEVVGGPGLVSEAEKSAFGGGGAGLSQRGGGWNCEGEQYKGSSSDFALVVHAGFCEYG